MISPKPSEFLQYLSTKFKVRGGFFSFLIYREIMRR